MADSVAMQNPGHLVAVDLGPERIDPLYRLRAPYRIARAARAHFGGDTQDLKTVEECQELIEALSRLSRALSQRMTAYRNGGARGQVDEEAGDVLLTLLGHLAEDGSPILDTLEAKAERLARKLEEARG